MHNSNLDSHYITHKLELWMNGNFIAIDIQNKHQRFFPNKKIPYEYHISLENIMRKSITMPENLNNYLKTSLEPNISLIYRKNFRTPIKKNNLL